MTPRTYRRWLTLLTVLGISSWVGFATAVLTGNPGSWLTGAVVSVALLTMLLSVHRRPQ